MINPILTAASGEVLDLALRNNLTEIKYPLRKEDFHIRYCPDHGISTVLFH